MNEGIEKMIGNIKEELYANESVG